MISASVFFISFKRKTAENSSSRRVREGKEVMSVEEDGREAEDFFFFNIVLVLVPRIRKSFEFHG